MSKSYWLMKPTLVLNLQTPTDPCYHLLVGNRNNSLFEIYVNPKCI